MEQSLSNFIFNIAHIREPNADLVNLISIGFNLPYPELCDEMQKIVREAETERNAEDHKWCVDFALEVYKLAFL